MDEHEQNKRDEDMAPEHPGQDDRTVGQRNLEHVLDFETTCNDPDCELHNPEVIETSEERWTAKASYLAGAKAMMRAIDDAFSERGVYDSNTMAMAIMELREKHGLSRNWP